MTQQSVEQTDKANNACWGWLEPGSSFMPCIALKDKGVAIGRGKEAFQERVQATEQTNSWTNQLFVGRNKGSEEYHGLDFAEVADGRISRMHCAVVRKQNSPASFSVILEDCSTNGTFVNNTKVGRGQIVILKDEDKISLVLSVTPLVERFYVFHIGPPPIQALEHFSRPGAVEERMTSRPSLSKCRTNKYVTEDRVTLEDLECRICLNPLVYGVTIEPCGHSFCAGCLSNYLASQLQSGAQLNCPLRCAKTQRFVKNDRIRDLVERKKTESGRLRSLDSFDDIEGIIEDEFSSTMSALCPLSDDHLPLEVGSLKTMQVDRTLERLREAGDCLNEQNYCLEVLARLSWSDDDVRKHLSDSQGIQLIKDTMESSMDNEAVQCNGCLALMAMVRGDGDICRRCQWEIGRSGTVEVIGKAMRQHKFNSMVQLSAMLCFIPLALDNPTLQAHLTQIVLSDVLQALDRHPTEADVQCKGLIVLGILAQGDDCLHDAIRTRQREAGMAKRIVAVLEFYGSTNEEVFWGALFALATMAREDSPRYNSICRSLCQMGMLELLTRVLDSYERRMEVSGQRIDETIVAAGRYLISAFSSANRKATPREWHRFMLCGLGLGLLLSSVYMLVSRRRRS